MTAFTALVFTFYILICGKMDLPFSWIDFVLPVALLMYIFVLEVGKSHLLLKMASNMDKPRPSPMPPDVDDKRPTTQEDPFFSKIK